MTMFAVTYGYTDDVTTRDSLRTEHRDGAPHGVIRAGLRRVRCLV